MGKRMRDHPGAIGFRVKTGRAVAVLLAGPLSSPRVLARREVHLCDMSDPDARQPNHAAMDMSEKDGALFVRRAKEASKRIGIKAMGDLSDELREHGYDLRAVGLVVGSVADPEKIGNDHVRAHALEGRLYRQALEAGAAACGVPCRILLEREAFEKAAAALGRTEGDLKQVVTALGKAVGRPWTSEEKFATLAAWLALTG